MERERFRKQLIGIALGFFIISHLLLGETFGQSAEEYFQLGKTCLENQQLTQAHTNFQNALSIDPNHQGANLFYGITRILMISQSTDFNTLLDRAGVSSSGRDIFNWTADFTRDPEGRILLPSNSPTGEELQNFLKNNVLLEVNGALGNLAKVGNEFQTTYKWPTEKGSGWVSSPNTLTDPGAYWMNNEWAGYKIVVQGTEYTVLSNTFNTLTVTPNWVISPGFYDYKILETAEIDYGDALVIKGFLYLAKGVVYILSAYNGNVDIDTIVSLWNAGALIFQNHVINTYTQLLTLLPDQQLSEAKSILREAINTFISAINFIGAETDPQENDFFIIDDPLKEQEYRDLLADLNDSLDGMTYIRKIEEYLNLSQFFDYPKSLRDYLPVFKGKYFILIGSFPDPTFGGILPNMTTSKLHQELIEAKLLFIPIGNVDFDADGDTDILWQHASSGQVAIWVMDGTNISQVGGPGTVSDTNWQIKAVGDFNNDGMGDILWHHSSSGQVAIWVMNGTNISQVGGPGTVSDTNWQIKAVGDFNNDGMGDILWHHSTTGQVAIWVMDGTNISQVGGPGTVSDTNWQIKAVGDFNNDGMADVLWHHSTTGQVAIWVMNGTNISQVGGPGIVGDTNWQIKAVGDFNNDGMGDILWHHSTTGQVAIWVMNGTNISQVGGPGTVGDTNWQIKN